MKKMNRCLLMVVLTLLMSVTFALFAACGNKATLSFQTNGAEEIADIDLTIGEKYTLQEPTKTGYSFEGWYTNADFEGEAITEIVVSEDTTLYAKWEQMYLLTLDANGGNLDVTSLYLKEGENVYDAVKAYVPTKADHAFGAWFMGNEELRANTRMTKQGLALKAEYKIKYLVECYEQALSAEGLPINEYIKADSSYEAYAYVGETVLAEKKLVGFYEVENANTLRQKEIKNNVEENVFKLYFDREMFEVTFDSNLPNGTQQSDTFNVYYGGEVEVPYYVATGYCLLGWATTSTGDVEIEANYIDYAMSDKASFEKATVKPSKDMTLYGVWMKGHTDMFNNSDTIYLFEEEVVVGEMTVTVYNVYLCRGGEFFKGESSNGNEFKFKVNGTLLMEGRLQDNGKFIYKNQNRDDIEANRFYFGSGLKAGEKIALDSWNGIKYIITGEDNKDDTSKGTYYINEEGYYVATFPETLEGEEQGSLGGKSLIMTIGYVYNSSNGTYSAAFRVRNENEIELGSLVRFAVYEGALSYYRYQDKNGNVAPLYDLTLDGFGSAFFHVGNGEGEYYAYIYDEKNEKLYLYDQDSGSLIDSMRIFYDPTLKKTGYMIFEEDLVGTFACGGGMVTLDGVCKATYKTETEELEGYYTFTQSALGGFIVDMSFGAKKLKMIVTITSVTVGDMIMKTTTSVEKTSSYKEYYYMTDSGVYYAPMLTLNNETEGDVWYYGYTDAQEYVLVAKGTYVQDAQTGLYTYTATYRDEEAVVSTKLADLSKITKIVFAVPSASPYAVEYHYWYSYTTIDSETQTENTQVNGETYESADGTKALTLISGQAFYKEDGVLIASGVYSKSASTGMITLETVNGEKLYFELVDVEVNSETVKKLVKFDYAPFTLKYLMADGNNISSLETLSFDGKGGVVYKVTTKSTTEGESDTVVEYAGSYQETGDSTLHGYLVFRFLPNDTANSDKAFNFIIISDHNVFAKYNAQYNGVYQSEKYGKLELDGYGYLATYTDTDGNTYSEKYFIENENEIKLSAGNSAFVFFDLKENREFTLRGLEYGTYLYMDNQLFKEVMFQFDGYGNLQVIKMVEDTQNAGQYVEQVVATGTYAFDNEWVLLKYKLEGASEFTTHYGQLGYYYDTNATYNVFFEYRGEEKQTYVNTNNYNVMQLDGFGNATVFGDYGVVEYGYYTLVTDSLLYYVNSSGTDARLYKYNTQAKTAIPVKLTARGYYTQDLETLLFTQYGFAIFNGNTRYYYYIDADNNVIIYREANEGETHNGYGFIADDSFGAYESKVYYDAGNGKKWYYASEKNGLTFERNADNKQFDANDDGTADTNLYALNGQEITKLTFAPSGEGTFVAAGTVQIGGKDKSCTVVRRVLEDDSVEFYMMVGDYRFDITVDYKGDMDDSVLNTYRITNMSKVITLPAQNYLTMYYLYYMFLGEEAANSYENKIGEITIMAEYNKDGTEKEFYVSGVFGEKSGMYDANGELVDSLDKLALYDADGKAFESIEQVNVKDSNKIYKLSTMIDGYTYNLYLVFTESSYVTGVYGYNVYAFTREEVLTTSDNTYRVTVERVITSDLSSLKAGTIFMMSIETGAPAQEGEGVVWTKVEGGEAWYSLNGYTYYIVREKDETTGLITSSTYFKIELLEEEKQLGDNEEPSKNPVALYKQLKSVEPEAVTTIYGKVDKTGYIDVNNVTGQVMILCVQGTAYIAMESTCEEVEGKKVYTVKLSSTIFYKVTVEEEGIVIELIEETEEEEA